MNRGGRGYFTPRGRGRGGPRSSPSYAGSTDVRIHSDPGGAGPSSRNHNSGDKYTTFDNSTERSFRHRGENSSGGKQMSWERRTNSNQAQQVNSSDLSYDSTPKSFSDGQRFTFSQSFDEWMVVSPSSYRVSSGQGFSPITGDRAKRKDNSLQSKNRAGIVSSDLKQFAKQVSPGCTFGISNHVVAEESSPDGHLALDQSFDSSQQSDCVTDAKPFDICPPKDGRENLNASLYDMNKEKRNQKNALAYKGSVLRSGMVLLKNFITISEQVKLVKECRKLGLGTGGFYQPGYRDGAKLNLRMMCLGKNWDPQSSSYSGIRPTDGAKPPPIPVSFLELVKRSIEESHTLISQKPGSTERVEAILPWMSPDICLVNFYTTTSRLGLHQDRDESEESLGKGLPVVSVSIGDKAEFLYGDDRNVDKAEKVVLESGDVLIFGGESRHVFHGVSKIVPNTAPKTLLEATDLRAGRLNLTFREY